MDLTTVIPLVHTLLMASIMFEDTCVLCACTVELDFVPLADDFTMCALCEVNFYGYEDLNLDEPPYDDYMEDEPDPDWLRDY